MMRCGWSTYYQVNSAMFIFSSLFLVLVLVLLAFIALIIKCHAQKEATVHELRLAYNDNRVSSRPVVEFHLGEIKKLNPVLKGVLELNI